MKRHYRVVIPITDKVDFKPKIVRSEKDVHYILINGTINQKVITIINIYALNTHFCKTNTNEHNETDRSRYNNSGCCQYSHSNR
jgi:hypothetical protein